MCRAGGTPAGGALEARPRPPMALGDPHRRPTPTSTPHPTAGLSRVPRPSLPLRALPTGTDRPAAQRARPPSARHPRLPPRTAHLVAHRRRHLARSAARTRPRRDRPDPRSRRDRQTTNAQTDRRRARHHARAPALPRAQAPRRNATIPRHRPRRRESGSPPCSAAEQLRELINQGNSLRQIEARYGISRKTLRDELVAHRIPIPAGPRHPQATRRTT